MARCRTNRKKRQKRNKKFLQRLAEKRYWSIYSKQCGGLSADYYHFWITPKTTVVNGVRVFHRNMKMYATPNAKYHDTISELMKSCKDITVQLPAEWFQKDD